MQFKVPQFLDVEDKIFGPFTFKQFVYLAGGAGLCFVVYKILGLLLGAIPILLIAGFAVALAFYRPNNKPLLNMVEAGFKFYTQNKLYVWKRRMKKPEAKKEKVPETGATTQTTYSTKNITGSKIKDLAWSLDVLDLSKNKEQ
ncbi:MAG TPA: PrgI family protein [Candidatus Paceibacterota bacterium]|nr:PrgI family protein [Candidatus Paceibacterota bacterium]